MKLDIRLEVCKKFSEKSLRKRFLAEATGSSLLQWGLAKFLDLPSCLPGSLSCVLSMCPLLRVEGRQQEWSPKQLLLIPTESLSRSQQLYKKAAWALAEDILGVSEPSHCEPIGLRGKVGRLPDRVEQD